MRRVRLKPTNAPASHRVDYAWWRVDVTSARDRWCFCCSQTIPAGRKHARDDNGRRLCMACVALADVVEEMTAAETNRDQRERQADREAQDAIRFLLDGLGVRSIQELETLVQLGKITSCIEASIPGRAPN